MRVAEKCESKAMQSSSISVSDRLSSMRDVNGDSERMTARSIVFDESRCSIRSAGVDDDDSSDDDVDSDSDDDRDNDGDDDDKTGDDVDDDNSGDVGVSSFTFRYFIDGEDLRTESTLDRFDGDAKTSSSTISMLCRLD